MHGELGFPLYGYNPLEKDHPKHHLGDKLKPALDVWSKVVSVHDVKTGEGVSYNFTWGAEHDCQVATVPFGYNEGLPRVASNKIVFG